LARGEAALAVARTAVARRKSLNIVRPSQEGERLVDGPGNRLQDAVLDASRGLWIAPTSISNNHGSIFAYSMKRNEFQRYISGIGVGGGIDSDGLH
jgi:hypothetical protein